MIGVYLWSSSNATDVIRLTENKFFSEAQHINVTLLFNNHITMAHSDDESELSEASTTISTSFTIAARTTTSSHHPAKQTRNISTRRGVVDPNGFRPSGRTVQMDLDRLTIWTDYEPFI